MISIEALVVGPFQSNCYIASCTATHDAMIVDAGDEDKRICQVVGRLGVNVVAIVCTHGHLDHVSALPGVRAALGAPVFMHRAEIPVYEMVDAQAASFGLPSPGTVPIDRVLDDGDSFALGKLRVTVRWTPGHSPGGICLLLAEPTPPVAFVGDVIFRGSIGRTDLPGSDAGAMRTSLRGLLSLPGDTVVYPGHGTATTMETEKRTNPFLLSLAG